MHCIRRAARWRHEHPVGSSRTARIKRITAGSSPCGGSLTSGRPSSLASGVQIRGFHVVVGGQRNLVLGQPLFGCSSRATKPWRLHPVFASHVRGVTTGGASSSQPGGAKEGGSFQPSNQKAELHGSSPASLVRCFTQLVSTYTIACRTSRGVGKGRAWYRSAQTRPRRPSCRLIERAKRMASPPIPRERERPCRVPRPGGARDPTEPRSARVGTTRAKRARAPFAFRKKSPACVD
jgi:hypothetical protein